MANKFLNPLNALNKKIHLYIDAEIKLQERRKIRTHTYTQSLTDRNFHNKSTEITKKV